MKTIKTKNALLSVLLIAMGMSGIQKEATAYTNVNNACSPSEIANFTCANVGNGNTIKFLGAFPSSECKGGSTPCTLYFYKYSGSTTSQVNVAIPIKLTQTLRTAQDMHCSQYFTGGSGDPTTGFGKYQKTLGICRIAFNLMGVPAGAISTIPSDANSYVATDPSASGPLDWQFRLVGTSRNRDDDHHHDHDDDDDGQNTIPVTLSGPLTAQSPVLESGATLTTTAGATVSYTNNAGNIKITGGVGRVVPIKGTKLCIVNPNGDPNVPYTDLAFASNWTCETITYATEQCDIKTSGTDPCRFIGGNCIKY